MGGKTGLITNQFLRFLIKHSNIDDPATVGINHRNKLTYFEDENLSLVQR
jgi:hypothetical protein